MQNFYTPSKYFSNDHIELAGEEYHHATRSCRVRIGEEIGVTDGMGRRVIARIDTIDHERLGAVILEDVSGQGEPVLHLTMALSIIKAARFEIAVEKCSEIGVTRIVPVITERMEPHADNRLKGGRLTRIAQSAAKQAARSVIPVIGVPQTIDEVLATTERPVFVASQHTDGTVATALGAYPDTDKATCLVGPEGDFTEAEYLRMNDAGVIPVSLGGLTLRAETAAIAATILFLQAAAERK